MEQEEIVWVQRARANWLKHGYRNTSFFHNFASSRRKVTTIKSLVDDNGARQEDRNIMCSMVKDYSTNLFTSEVGEVDMEVLRDVKRRVSPYK